MPCSPEIGFQIAKDWPRSIMQFLCFELTLWRSCHSLLCNSFNAESRYPKTSQRRECRTWQYNQCRTCQEIHVVWVVEVKRSGVNCCEFEISLTSLTPVLGYTDLDLTAYFRESTSTGMVRLRIPTVDRTHAIKTREPHQKAKKLASRENLA